MRLRFAHGQPAGVALVVTLLMMSILTMMVVGLAAVMRNEQAAARNLTYQVLAEQMAEIGARQAMATVLSNSPASGQPCATGPGWMLANGTLVPLFSSNTANQSVNLEKVGTNSMILSIFSGQSGDVRADWTNVVPPAADANFPVGRYAWWVDDEGTKANLNQIGDDKTSASTTTSLLPLQTSFPLNFQMVFATQSGAATTSGDLARLTNRGHYIFSPEMLKDSSSGPTNVGADTYRNYKGQITAWSSNIDLTPWGTPRINLADLGVIDPPSRDAAYNNLRTTLKSGAWSSFFPASSLARKYGGGGANAGDAGNHGDLTIDQIAANLVAVATTNRWPIQCANFQPNAANNAVDRYRNGLPLTVSSDHLGPYLSEVWVRIDAVTTNRIQVAAAGRGGGNVTNILGSGGSVRLGIMVRLTNPYSQPMANFRLEIQPRKFRFKVLQDTITYANRNPLPAPNLLQMVSPLTQGAGSPTLTANALSWVTTEGRGGVVPLGWWLGPEWLKDRGGTMRIFPWDLDQIFSLVLSDTELTTPPIFSKTIDFQMNVNAAGALNAAGLVNETFVQIDQVRLVQTNGNRLVDWMSMDDLAQDGNFRSTIGLSETIDPAEDYGQLPFGVSGTPINANIQRATAPNATLPGLSSASFTSGTATGIFRTDPRVRFPLSHWDTNGTQRGVLKTNGWPATVKAWTTEPSAAVRRANTGIAYLPADPASAAANPHPHFVSGYLPTNGIQSVAQLGAIHTGLPWRTLRFLPTPATELAQGPPDWILLDLFTVTNPSVARPMINLNSVGLERVGQILVDGTVEHRAMVPVAAMGPLINTIDFFKTNQISNNLAAWGVPVSFATDSAARIAPTGATLTNLAPALQRSLANPGTATNWYTDGTLSSGWGGWRSGASAFWPAQGLAFRGEITELPFWNQASGDLTEDQQEGRLRFFMDLLTTRSDTFTAWSAGQGLMVFTNSLGQVRTNVMGEVRKQTVFQRVPQTNAAGAVTNWQVKVLYTRNHVVE